MHESAFQTRLRGAISACWPALPSRSCSGQPAKATDEIQVYNAGIAAPGQFTIQQHLNYVPLGVKDPPFPGGLISNNSINGTPEFAYGVTDWWEVGLYLPFAIKDQQFLSECLQAADPVRLAQCRPAQLLLRRQFRIQQHHAEILADEVCAGDPARSSASATRTMNSSSTRSWTSASANLARRTLRLRRAWRESSTPDTVHRPRILRRLRRDREFRKTCRPATYAVRGHRFQARRL